MVAFRGWMNNGIARGHSGNRPFLWAGTPESEVDLTPPDFTEGRATDVYDGQRF